MSHIINGLSANFVKMDIMQKLLSKIDWRLVMRLIMAGSMIIVGYQGNDYIPAVFGLGFAIYAIIGAKYKIGCGYNGACGYPSQFESKINSVTSQSKSIQTENIEFTEIK
jgi:hypothetical protein